MKNYGQPKPRNNQCIKLLDEATFFYSVSPHLTPITPNARQVFEKYKMDVTQELTDTNCRVPELALSSHELYEVPRELC